MTSMATGAPAPWYRSLSGAQWKALVASNLGWTFDGFEVYSLILVVGVALHQLLDPAEYKFIPFYAGAVIAITVFGWGLGGLLGGILADYIGRKRSMMITILAYSALTGLSALSWSWLSFAVFRFLVGLAIGSEWATGASITAELWPNNARGKGGAFLQAGYPIGSILASGVWLAHRQFRTGRLALHVPGRRAAGADRFLDPAQYSRIAALGGIRQAPSRRLRSAAQGCGA